MKKVKPKWFLLENVASMSDEDRDTVSKNVGVKHRMIPSALFCAQARERYYWTNFEINLSKVKDKRLVIKDILEEDIDEKYYLDPKVYKSSLEGIEDLYTDRQPLISMPEYYKSPRQIGIINNKKAQGYRVYDAAGKYPTVGATTGGGPNNPIFVDGKLRKLTWKEFERLQTFPDDWTKGHFTTKRKQMIGNSFNVDTVSFILSHLKRVKRNKKTTN